MVKNAERQARYAAQDQADAGIGCGIQGKSTFALHHWGTQW